MQVDTIYTGNAMEMAHDLVDDATVSLIFTDPVYDQIDQYEWLGHLSMQVLQPQGKMLVWWDEINFDAIYRAMVPPLQFAGFMHWQRYGHMSPSRSGLTVITPCLWLELPGDRSRTYSRIANWMGVGSNTGSRMASAQFKWSKPEQLLRKWIGAFTQPGDLVLDPFTGTGTVPAVCKMLGRHYIGFEIDEERAAIARERVALTPVPLVVEGPGAQMEMPGVLAMADESEEEHDIHECGNSQNK